MIIDMEAIVAAYEHGLVFCAEDINHYLPPHYQLRGFGPPGPDATTQKHFEPALNPRGWIDHNNAPWYLNLELRNGLQ